MDKINSYVEDNKKQFIKILIFVLIIALVTTILNYNHADVESSGLSFENLFSAKYPPLNILMGIMIGSLAFLMSYNVFKMENTLLNKILLWISSFFMLLAALHFFFNGLGLLIGCVVTLILGTLFIFKSIHWFHNEVYNYY